MTNGALTNGTGEAEVESAAPVVVTWNALVTREPRLADLYAEISHVTDDRIAPTFCANRLWYVQFEPRLLTFVGSRAELDDELVRSSGAYTLARRTLYRLLPDCRSCVCVPW